jgi:HEPN domain-containing protein
MNRIDLQRIAVAHLDAAKSLIESRHWGPAYYLAGYSVECGLKACIARQFREYDFPDRQTVIDSYTHDLGKLVRTAGLSKELRLAEDASDFFKLNWTTVKDWSAESRYEDRSQSRATGIITAIDAKPNGVLEWITQHW